VRAIPEVPYSAFQERIARSNGRRPSEATLETTFRCNLRCAHCYVNQPAGAPELRARELPVERLKRLVDELAEAGILHILLTGGEPLLRPDFEELYVHAVERGLLPTLFTNGTLVTADTVALLDRYRPRKIEITLYGMTRETYERVTGVPGSFDRCLAGIDRLLAHKLPLSLKTMALRWNQHEIPAMEAFARERGVDFRFDPQLNPRVDCGASRVGELQIRARDVLALEARSPRLMQEFRELCSRPAPPTARADDRLFTCGAGELTVTIDPYGRLHMCQLLRRSFYDLAQGSFEEGWQSLVPRERARVRQARAACSGCGLSTLCGSCPGAAEMEHGDPEAVVTQFCEIAHLRADAALGASSGHRSDASCCLEPQLPAAGGQGLR
jgi:radical SAM protein with 4Fe4S-binding SPASM domain